jgi:oxygen-independent coproporphyrinogen-3 oxidase
LEHLYLDALLREIRTHQWPWTPETVYIGGGTPSRLVPDQLARILAAIPGTPWREATLEAAPGSITPALAASWKQSGITRVSVGVQSFAEEELRLTARRHNALIVEHDVELLRNAGLGNFNVDLIAGLAAQTPESWDASLDWVERLHAPHVSVYILEVDEDSRLGLEIINSGSRYGAARLPAEEETVRFYETAVDRLAALGIARYEISNFARPGFESRHNLKYWRMEPYIGFGADAHSFDGQMRWRNTDNTGLYLRGEGLGIDREPASPGERLFTGLRLMEGIEATQENSAVLARFERAGLLERDGSRLRLTRRGVLLSNEVFQEFV